MVVFSRLVLADTGMEGHLAEMARFFLDPVGMLGDEPRVVEIGKAAQRTFDRGRRTGTARGRVLAAAVGRSQDQAAYGSGMVEGELLQNHPAHRQSEPVRRRLAGIA